MTQLTIALFSQLFWIFPSPFFPAKAISAIFFCCLIFTALLRSTHRFSMKIKSGGHSHTFSLHLLRCPRWILKYVWSVLFKLQLLLCVFCFQNFLALRGIHSSFHLSKCSCKTTPKYERSTQTLQLPGCSFYKTCLCWLRPKSSILNSLVHRTCF